MVECQVRKQRYIAISRHEKSNETVLLLKGDDVIAVISRRLFRNNETDTRQECRYDTL